jgi:HAD superfamily hydrolase (TIGR01509 family)
MQKKVYFFDMDGTLIDSMSLAWEKVIFKYLDDRAIQYDKDIILDIVTKGFMGISKYFVEKLGVQQTPQQLYDYFMQALEPMYQNEFPLKEGAIEIIKKFKSEGAIVNVISGSPLRFVIPCFKRLGLYGLFDNICSLEDFKLTKADKELFVKLAEKMEVAPTDCVLIDDSVNAIKTAKSVGYQTIGVYEVMVKNGWEEMLSVADKTIMSFAELT